MEEGWKGGMENAGRGGGEGGEQSSGQQDSEPQAGGAHSVPETETLPKQQRNLGNTSTLVVAVVPV